MEKAKYDWVTFTSRRRINVKMWLESNGIDSYEKLKEKCVKLGVEVPKMEDVSTFFPQKIEKTKEKFEVPAVVEVKPITKVEPTVDSKEEEVSSIEFVISKDVEKEEPKEETKKYGKKKNKKK